ncbi:ParB/RepB/Spo0J family partition protein [uncultured Subdoligranulum sp.]|uniref:ParB/RepB/Spo0J family partition protein n=1 Tax=uncultured Subdoligranulum sp. TaxID=512298 RepID=UPI0025F4000A|nr:ParB/RepB/Spo0J family partition protein [uncultured Subdoligranulum sp.]
MSERRRYEINPSFADLFTTQEDRDEAKLEKVQMLPLDELNPFPDHPFEVRDDEEMEKLVDSIRVHGVLMPAIARTRPDGSYELVAGHRRKRACELAGLQEMPVLIRKMDDDTATILMVDSNVQREHVLPSEKAKAYKMKLDAIKRKSGRPSKENSRQVVGNFESADLVGETSGESGRQVQRYIRLNNLIPELMELVDENKLKFNPAVEISYLTPDEQADFFQYIDGQACSPSLSQAQKLKAASREGTLTTDRLESIMTAQPPSVKPREAQISISLDRVSKYFPKGFTSEQIVNQILKILEAQYRKKNRDMER